MLPSKKVLTAFRALVVNCSPFKKLGQFKFKLIKSFLLKVLAKSWKRVVMDLIPRPVINWSKVDERGHLKIRPRSLVGDRYEVEATLGAGTFGKVWRVTDILTNVKYAMKISVEPDEDVDKKNDVSEEGAVINKGWYREVKILRYLNSLDPYNFGWIVKMYDNFNVTDSRIAIILELCGGTLFSFVERNNFHPLQNDQAIHIAHQILSGVDFLHQHKLMHTDIKPENIGLICSEYEAIPAPNRDTKLDQFFNRKKVSKVLRLMRTDIRILDLGSAIKFPYMCTGKIGTREYRSPESILKMRWHSPADMWSVGCTLFDIFTGNTLFLGIREDNLHLHKIESLIGSLPQRLLDCNVPDKFLNEREQKLKKRDRESSDPRSSAFSSRLFNYFDHDDPIQYQAFKLIQKLLRIEPLARLTAEEALQDVLFDNLPNYFKRTVINPEM